MNKLRILFLASEIAPFAKTGGLADVGGSLPKALRELGHDVRVVMPAYASIETQVYNRSGGFKVLPPISVPVAGTRLPAGVFENKLPGSDVTAYFIAEGNLFNRMNLYGYQDDPYRFAFFSRAALELTRVLGWKPDLVHANDWHTAPAITWLATAAQADDFLRDIPTLFTIHNLAHQGHSDWGIFDYLGIQSYRLAEEGYDEVNWMARGIHHATLINTVSPTYAREILTAAGGSGMDALLRHRSADLHGILNGIDYDEWNPQRDPSLPQNYTPDQLELRLQNKLKLQERAGLQPNPDIPLVGMVTRLDRQKGLDITGQVIHLLMNGFAGESQFVLLGTGAAEYHEMLLQLSVYYRPNMRPFLTYDAELAHLIYAGSDLLLMPSLFEPCGLGQLIAMRYGCVPVVRATGGLADTVRDSETGFTFYEYNSEAFFQAVQRAIYLYRTDKAAWQAIQRAGMISDFSWTRSALGYQQLYQWAAARAHLPGD